MTLALKHQTEEQFIARVRQAYRNAIGDEAINVAAYIDAAIQRGDLVDATVRAAFGMTAAQWVQARNRMKNMVAARNTGRIAIGE